MKWLRRLRLRLGMVAARVAGDIGRSLSAVLVVVVGVVLVFAIWLGTGAGGDDRGGFPGLLRDQAVSALSLAVIGVVAWFGFRLRFRDAKMRYLRSYRRPARPADEEASSSQVALLRAVADHLVAARPPRSLLVVSESGGFPSAVEQALPNWIAARGLIPVVVDVAQYDSVGSIPALSRQCFVSRLAGSTGDEPRAQRLFTREADRGKIIVLIAGLGYVAEAKPRAARRHIVEVMLRDCIADRLPFVAAVSDELAPRISEVAVVRTASRYERAALRRHLESLLVRRGVALDDSVRAAVQAAFDDPEPTSDPWYLELAADVVVTHLRDGQAPDEAVREVFSTPGAFRRQLSWLCESALGSGVENLPGDSSHVLRSLAAIGRQAHYRQEVTTRWRDVTRDYDAEDELHFAAAVSALARRNVITVVGESADPGLTFNHPEWLSFAGALGLGLDGVRWAELLTPGVPPATVNSLTATLVLHHADPTTRSFLSVLRQLKQGDLHDVSLDMILAVVRALQVDPRPLTLGGEEINALRRAWRTSTDQARLMLVAALRPHPAIAEFFWEQVVPPQFEANSYRLRRVICVRLAGMGTVAWRALAEGWAALVADAASSDLSARARLTKTDWVRHGLPLASLAWLLPSLIEHLAGPDREVSMRMLGDIRQVVTSYDAGGGPDVGLEISLAEGFKLASVARVDDRSTQDRPWVGEARRLLRDARSWTSQQVLCQALTLVAPGSAAPPEVVAAQRHAHPLVREAAALARRTLPGAGGGATEVDNPAGHIWFDDVQALEDGGFELSAEAHRLLALSTLLINLAEGAHERAARTYAAHGHLSAEVWQGVDSRELALTSNVLPKCFVSATRAVTMLDVECDCPFRLCGQTVRGKVGHRDVSRAFAQRAEITSAAPAALGRRTPFVRRAFGGLWQRPEIVRDDPGSSR